MAWKEPNTTWLETDRCTFSDINRIASNINMFAGTSLKDDYTQDDVISADEWDAIIDVLIYLAEEWDYVIEDVPDASTTALNFNRIESLTLALHDWILMTIDNAEAAVYLGDGVYFGDDLYFRRTDV